ncbi:MAG: 50S ribosomal protein L14e [Candidatus Micrarchaeota archaeon]
MPAIQVGRVCVKIAGRDAGERVVVSKLIDGHYVEVTSPARKKPRKCAIRHLEPTEVVVS